MKRMEETKGQLKMKIMKDKQLTHDGCSSPRDEDIDLKQVMFHIEVPALIFYYILSTRRKDCFKINPWIGITYTINLVTDNLFYYY